MEITEKAKVSLKKLLEDKKPYFRVKVVTGGCSGFSYKFEALGANEVKTEDLRYAIDNSRYVVVDVASDKLLKNASLDYADTIAHSGFKIVNPEAKSTCGCGVSFDI